MHGVNVHARVNDLDLDARSQWVGKGNTISVELSRQLKQATSIKLATTVGLFFFFLIKCDLRFDENVYLD